MQRLFMETTKIPPEDTVAQIQKILGKYGAGKILTEYERGEVSGLSFIVDISGHSVPFTLPCRWKSIHEVLLNRIKKYHSGTEERITAQAKRVAWRQILRWVEAQMALVQTDMVKIQEVFLPYMRVNKGQTLYEQLEQDKFKMLEHKK